MLKLPPHQRLGRKPHIPYNSVGELFAERALKDPDKTFLICPGKTEETFSYKSFRHGYLRAARYLSSHGLRKGDRFNLVFSNSPEFLLLYFAGLTLGITVVPINPDLSPEEMRYIVEDSQSKAIFYSNALGEKMERLQAADGRVRTIVGINSTKDWETTLPGSSGASDLPDKVEIEQTDECHRHGREHALIPSHIEEHPCQYDHEDAAHDANAVRAAASVS